MCTFALVCVQSTHSLQSCPHLLIILMCFKANCASSRPPEWVSCCSELQGLRCWRTSRTHPRSLVRIATGLPGQNQQHQQVSKAPRSAPSTKTHDVPPRPPGWEESGPGRGRRGRLVENDELVENDKSSVTMCWLPRIPRFSKLRQRHEATWKVQLAWWALGAYELNAEFERTLEPPMLFRPKKRSCWTWVAGFEPYRIPGSTSNLVSNAI